jgi:hypothetical protein
MPGHLFGTPCRTARRNGSWAIPSLCRATPSAISEHLMGLFGSSPIPRSLIASCVSFQLRPLPSPGITRLPQYYGPLRHARRPGLSLASRRLIGGSYSYPYDHQWGFPCCVCSHISACRRQYPGRTDRTVRSSPVDVGLPSIRRGSAPASPVSGPAQRSPSLRPTNSPSHLRDPLHQRLQQLRYLHYCSDCYRVDRTSSRAGLSPAVDQRLFTAHAKVGLRAGVRSVCCDVVPGCAGDSARSASAWPSARNQVT